MPKSKISLAVMTATIASMSLITACSTTENTSDAVKSLSDSSGPPIFEARPRMMLGTVAADEREPLETLFETARTVLESDTFHANMIASEGVTDCCWLSKADGKSSTENLAKTLRLTSDSGRYFGWAPMTINLVGSASGRGATLSGDAAANIRMAGPRNVDGVSVLTETELDLGRLHLLRSIDDNQVQQSCAINTMAHEIAHSLSNQPRLFIWHIKDKEKRFLRPNPKPKGMRYASYRVGTIAQCSWLQDQGRIEPDDLAQCIDAFEAMKFKSGSCKKYDNDTDMFPE